MVEKKKKTFKNTTISFYPPNTTRDGFPRSFNDSAMTTTRVSSSRDEDAPWPDIRANDARRKRESERDMSQPIGYYRFRRTWQDCQEGRR